MPVLVYQPVRLAASERHYPDDMDAGAQVASDLFTIFHADTPDGERLSQETRVPMCMIRGKCAYFRVKTVEISGHLPVAQRPDLSVEDALAFITLDSDYMCTISTTSAVLTKRQVAVRKQMLEALAQRSDLTSEQAAQIAEAFSSFSDVQP